MKYYYTCPLKAAYMAKYFGMRYEYRVDSDNPSCDSEFQVGDKYFIHPDSLHLLKFREGDEADHLGGGGEYMKILRRDGVQFMWPEHD